MKSLNGRNLKKNFSYELLKGQNWTHEKKILLNFLEFLFLFLPFEQILKLAKCLEYKPYDNVFNTYIWHNHAQNLKRSQCHTRGPN